MHGRYEARKSRARRMRRRLYRGWRYRIPAEAFKRKRAPFWKVPTITRRHHEE